MAAGKEKIDIHKDIIKFITKRHVASLAINSGDTAWGSCCFYAFKAAEPSLVFLSHGDTEHARLMLDHPLISGTISAQTSSVLRIKGLQFKGTAFISTDRQIEQHIINDFHLPALWMQLCGKCSYTI